MNLEKINLDIKLGRKFSRKNNPRALNFLDFHKLRMVSGLICNKSFGKHLKKKFQGFEAGGIFIEISVAAWNISQTANDDDIDIGVVIKIFVGIHIGVFNRFYRHWPAWASSPCFSPNFSNCYFKIRTGLHTG